MAQIDSSSSGVVLSAEELAEGIDQSSPDWRMAYAIADAELADRRGHEQVQQRATFRARMRERRRATTRFVILAGILSATGCPAGRRAPAPHRRPPSAPSQAESAPVGGAAARRRGGAG